jgi:hypothetical protein
MKYEELNFEQKITVFNTAINLISFTGKIIISPKVETDDWVKEVLKVAKVIASNLEPS